MKCYTEVDEACCCWFVRTYIAVLEFDVLWISDQQNLFLDESHTRYSVCSSVPNSKNALKQSGCAELSCYNDEADTSVVRTFSFMSLLCNRLGESFGVPDMSEQLSLWTQQRRQTRFEDLGWNNALFGDLLFFII